MFIPADGDRVVVPIRIRNVGREDIEIGAHFAMLVTVGDGKITHMRSFQSKAEALEAVGLSE